MLTTIPVLCGSGREARMIKRIVAVGVCIFILMVVIKDGRVLRTTGLTGSCSVTQTFTDSSELAACRPGKLEGRPDLSHRGCRSVGVATTYEYWRCPAGFDISDASR
jgi:hypothetical protein